MFVYVKQKDLSSYLTKDTAFEMCFLRMALEDLPFRNICQLKFSEGKYLFFGGDDVGLSAIGARFQHSSIG